RRDVMSPSRDASFDARNMKIHRRQAHVNDVHLAPESHSPVQLGDDVLPAESRFKSEVLAPIHGAPQAFVAEPPGKPIGVVGWLVGLHELAREPVWTDISQG